MQQVAVLGKYDGRTWKRRQDARPDIPPFQLKQPPVRYQVTLEPNSKRWLMLLEMPGAPPKINGMSTYLNTELEPSTDQPITNRLRYDAQSYLGVRVFPDMPSDQLQYWLELPVGYDPATISFARQLRSGTTNDVQRINAVLRYFHDESFRYTLQPPTLGRHAIDEFLFATRTGFCEHYASAFVVLMRAMGIPARVINGYQGGEINPVDGFMTIRQSDAHAWAEVWLPGQGWLRVDPTSAVAPERVEQGMNVAMPRTMLSGLITMDLSGSSWLAKLRYRWDAVANGWNQWVLNYTPEKQKSFIKSLGFEEVDWRTLSILLATITTIVLAVTALPLLANRQKRDPARELYLRFCQSMARKGWARFPYEGPRDYRKRIENGDASLAAEKKSAAARFLAFYETVQYGTLSGSSNSENIARLKSLLAECR